MKNITILFAFAVMFTAFQCDNEPVGEGVTGTNPESNTSIIGNWLLTEWNVVEPIDLNNDGVASTQLLTEIDCYTNETLSFSGNGTGIAVSNSFAEISFEQDADDVITYIVDCILDTDIVDLNWQQSTTEDNVYLLTVDGASLTATITGNTLTYVIPEGFFIADDMGDATIEQDLTFVYTKQ